MSDDEMPSLADLMDGDDEDISDVDYVTARVAESTEPDSTPGSSASSGAQMPASRLSPTPWLVPRSPLPPRSLRPPVTSSVA
ncbi:GTP-binding protein Era [Cutibacterium acnes JCM 18909]|nr:GTP-binding protein Era [Cutibacterium acnes JCM 18909]